MTTAVYSSSAQGAVARILPDILRHRGLLRDLISKDLRARYRNAMAGFLWAVLQPLLFTLILAFVFTVVFQVGGRGGIRQSALEILSKLIFWQFFATALAAAANALIDNRDLVKKVQFPRELIPLAAIANALVNLAIGFGVLLVVQTVMTGPPPPIAFLVLPFILLIELALVCGLGLLVAAANVHFRDTAYLLEILLTFGFYASPVLYPMAWVGPRFAEIPAIRDAGLGAWLETIYALNPMAGLLTACSDLILDGRLPALALIASPILWAGAALLIGGCVFRRLSPLFADHL